MTTRELVERVSLDLADDDFDLDDTSVLEEMADEDLLEMLSGIGGPGSLLVH